MSRVEQVERNRALVLAAARRVFLGRGYAGASLEAIAEEAGFSKGVVYSQFDSKADLFLELLAARIAERAEQHERLALELGDARLVQAVAEQTDSIHQAEPQWSLLVIEFRAHAARVPELNRRYALLHAQTVQRLAGFFAGLHERNGTRPQYPPRVLAELVLALGSGVALERIADPGAVPPVVFAQAVNQMAATPAGNAGPAQEPAAGEPASGEPAPAGPAAGEPATGGLVTGGPVTGGLVTGGLVTGGLVTGEPVTGGLVTGGLVTGGLVTDDPAAVAIHGS